MTTEARDALAAALDECGFLDTAYPPSNPTNADAILAALPDGWTLARREDAEDGAAREFRALVDEARASHVRWEHDAEVLEECRRSLCIGARVLLWPDPDAPRLSATAAARKATEALR